jgi:phosphoglycolate phosphatase-like HAD superfamily hydrolase
VSVSGNLVANSLTIGSGVFQFSRANVFFATTTTTDTTELITLDADEVSSVDFTVIATDDTSRSRQVSKLSAVMYDANVNYNEYSTLFVNDLVGDFSVGYNAGNAIVGPSVTLFVEPETVNTTTYKIQITVYDD